MALSKSLATSSSLPDLPPQPSHPPSKFVFPKQESSLRMAEFGKKQIVKRSCQASWFSTWPWLHYQTHNPDDVVFCHVCVSALKSKRMERSRGNLAFTSNGFKNWKDATISFKNHEASASHKEALQVVMVIPATCSDVGEMLSREHAKEEGENCQCLIRILSNIHFLGLGKFLSNHVAMSLYQIIHFLSRQGLALRGEVT